jgi:hypothetical protein
VIAALVSDPLPAFIYMPEADCADEEVIWHRAGLEWGREGPMRDAVLSSGAWRALFRRKPLPEVRSSAGSDRYDLLSEPDRAVAEFKLVANSTTLIQLDRYLDTLAHDHGGHWRGHIVWGNSCSRRLAEAVDRRSDIKLWRCDRTRDNRASLVRTERDSITRKNRGD